MYILGVGRKTDEGKPKPRKHDRTREDRSKYGVANVTNQI
jgi:hypothetical protein